MLKRLQRLFVVVATSLLLLSGCTSQAAETNAPTVTPTREPIQTATPEPTSTPTLKPKEESVQSPYQEIIKDAYISSGNNMRIKNIIEKARNGEPVNIACIGGSVTEGYMINPNTECYADKFYQMFKDKYGKDDGANVKFANAGMSGTNSAIGWTRYGRDVTKALGGNPDILVIEYAINDYEDQFITKGAALESMLRDVLLLPNKPAVIMLFSTNWDWGNLQNLHIPIGNAYNLPMVSMYNGVTQHIIDGDIAKEDFFLSDNDHPTKVGHMIMAESLMYCIDKIDKETADEEDITLPDEPVVANGKDYQGLKVICEGDVLPEGLKLTLGSFTTVDTMTNKFDFNGEPKYPRNWKRDVTTNSPFVIEVNCKNMLLVYKSANDYGKADIYLDGVKVKTEDGRQGGGWNNAVATLLFNDATASNHKIEIKMADGSQDLGFTILEFGYTE